MRGGRKEISNYRIGLIVPSSNTTMEIEVPTMLKQKESENKDISFSFHSSRMRMKEVSARELGKMNKDSEKCALELSDAKCDVLINACLIAIMSQGKEFHIESKNKLEEATAKNNYKTPVISSAEALIVALKSLKAKKISLITPYTESLTKTVVNYLSNYGIEVVDSISLEIPDNLKVGKLDPMELIEIANQIDNESIDTLIISACVQMQSLSIVQTVENHLGIPVISAATSTVYSLLKQLGLDTNIAETGILLSGRY